MRSQGRLGELISRRKHVVAATALGFATVVVLLAFRSLRQTGDSLSYAISIETGERLFHPHHLLFSPIVRLVYLVLQAVAPAVDAVLAGQIHNAVWAAAGVVGLYFISFRISGSVPFSVGAASLLLAAQGYLMYASQVEVYVAATACLILLVALLAGRWPERYAPSLDWILAALLALAVLYHQANVLFCAPLALFFLWNRGRETVVRGLRVILFAGGAVLALYAVVYLVDDAPHSVTGFFEFCLRYTQSERSWGSWDHYGSTGMTDLLRAQLWDGMLTSGSTRVVTAFGGLLGVATLWNAIRAFRLGPSGSLRALLVAWLVAYHGFLLWWVPGWREFLVITLPPVLLNLLLPVTDLPLFRRSAVLPAAVGLVLGLVGFAVLLPLHLQRTMLPLGRDRGPVYDSASAYVAAAPGECLWLAKRFVALHIRYYFDRDPQDVRFVGAPDASRPSPGTSGNGGRFLSVAA